MAIRDVLLALTTYPRPTPIAGVDEAIAFAAAIGARISAIACEATIPAMDSPLGNMLLDIPALVAAEMKKSAEHAERLLAAFRDGAEKAGVFQDRILERCLTSEVADVLVQYARLRDLTIVPMPEGDPVEGWYAESVIFGSGRPTVVMPQISRRTEALNLNTVVVAWDFSKPAARSVGDALSILKRAKQVYVVTVTNEKVIGSKRSGAELAKHLARHGVNVIVDVVDAAGRKIGDALEAYVVSRNGDLLVMGAYGHSRVREFILGGATRSLLSHPPLPILLSH